MLNKFTSILHYHLQAASNAFNLICKQPVATSIAILVIAISVTLPTLFWIFTSNIEQLTEIWQKNNHISLYLSSANPTENNKLLENVQHVEGVNTATLKTAAENLQALQHQPGMQNILRDLPQNPLPSIIEVTPQADINTPERLENLYARLKQLPQIEEAKLDLDWLKRLYALLELVRQIGQTLVILLTLAIIFIIGNALRLIVHQKTEEIRVLQLIGASSHYIKRPFLYIGAWYGLLGSVVAILLANIVIFRLTPATETVALAYGLNTDFLRNLSIQQAYTLVFLAMLLGWLSAHIALYKRINFSATTDDI